MACVVTNAKRLFEVWLVEPNGPSFRGAAFEGADCMYPFWSPEGKKVAYTRYGRTRDDGIYVQELGAGAAPRRVGTPAAGDATLLGNGCWSPDGSMILVDAEKPDQSTDLGVIELAREDDRVRRLFETREDEAAAVVSPDGLFLSHASDESGHEEVYLRRLLPGPTLGPAIPVSSRGAKFSRWSRDGRRLYFESSDGWIRYVTVGPGPEPAISAPTPVWDLQALHFLTYAWDLLPDGRLLGVRLPEEERELKQFDLVLHFDQEVRRKAVR